HLFKDGLGELVHLLGRGRSGRALDPREGVPDVLLRKPGRMPLDLEAEVALLEQYRRAVAAQHRIAQARLEPVPARRQRAGEVADVLVVHAEHGAQAVLLHHLPRPLGAVLAHAVPIDALLPIEPGDAEIRSHSTPPGSARACTPQCDENPSRTIVDGSIDVRRCHAGSLPGSAVSPAASMPAMAHFSSLSETSPEIPTAPITSPSWSRISTPDGAGMSRPPLAAASALKNAGCFGARPARARDPRPMPSAPQAFPKAMSKRRMPDLSSRLKATRCPPASRTATDSGWKLLSRPTFRAASMMVEACASVSDCISTPRTVAATM